MKKLIAGLLSAFLLAGCSSGNRTQEAVYKPVPEATKLRVADIPPPLGINVSILTFRVAESNQHATTQVRSVERRVLPYILKGTLERSGFWGAVRVMPRPDPNAEITIEGEILKSDGVELSIALSARDASGSAWLERVYTDVTDDLDYAADPVYRIDPFQDMYNRIANDMAAILLSMAHERLEALVDITTLQYSRSLSPESFDRYLTQGEQGLVLTGLPARDDPLYLRVQKIRESEYLFSDAVDAYYASLYRKLGPTYAWWRYYSYELIMGNERLSEIDATRGATRGSWYAMERIYKTYKESKMNEDALREMTDSFDRETAPTTAAIAGRVVELNGTLEEQYEEWRHLLRELYREETGN